MDQRGQWKGYVAISIGGLHVSLDGHDSLDMKGS